MVEILIVDDSATARLALRHAIEAAPDLRVVGEAPTGARARRMIAELRPQLVTMDVQLGDDNGIEVAAEIMATHPTPILLVTGMDADDAGLAFRAVEAGALEVSAKPPGPRTDEYPEYCRRLQRLVRSLAGVPVVTRRRGSRVERAPEAQTVSRRTPPAPPRVRTR